MAPDEDAPPVVLPTSSVVVPIGPIGSVVLPDVPPITGLVVESAIVSSAAPVVVSGPSGLVACVAEPGVPVDELSSDCGGGGGAPTHPAPMMSIQAPARRAIVPMGRPSRSSHLERGPAQGDEVHAVVVIARG